MNTQDEPIFLPDGQNTIHEAVIESFQRAEEVAKKAVTKATGAAAELAHRS